MLNPHTLPVSQMTLCRQGQATGWQDKETFETLAKELLDHKLTEMNMNVNCFSLVKAS
ncbi:MAG: hypothetical protein PHU03_05355 [Syntrophales bacterium]|nr:hypothetical protein [Syntrophales bacterium]